MSEAYKLSEPLKIGDDFVFPLTSLSQVRMDDDTSKRGSETLVRKDKDVLTLEEIEASTSLEGKVAGADAVKRLDDKLVQKGKFQFLGSFGTYGMTNDTDFHEIILTDSINNYDFLLVICGYYPSPTAIYGHALIPSRINWGEGWFFKVENGLENGVACIVRDSSRKLIVKNSLGYPMAAYGIK